MSIIDRVKTHFDSLKTITIEVPEWEDEEGKPSIFYSEPLTLEEKNIIFKKSNNFIIKNLNNTSNNCCFYLLTSF